MGDTHSSNGLTRQEAILLMRYVPAKFVLSRLKVLFLLKYLLVLLAAVVIAVGAPAWLAVAAIVLFVTAAAAQWLIRQTVHRLGAIRQLSVLDDQVEDVMTVWWPNLRRETARLGQATRPWGLLKLGTRLATRRRPADETVLVEVDWQSVIPREHWDRARDALARAASAPPAR